MAKVHPGRYLVDESGKAVYRTDLPVNREATTMDDGKDAPKAFDPPQPALFQSIIQGILGGTLEWSLVAFGVLIAVALELAGVPALPVAVGMYIAIQSTTPIFLGGLLRWLVDRRKKKAASELETETSPSVLLATGYIAGGTLCGLLVRMVLMVSEDAIDALNVGKMWFGEAWSKGETDGSKALSLAAFLAMAAVLFAVGRKKPDRGG